MARPFSVITTAPAEKASSPEGPRTQEKVGDREAPEGTRVILLLYAALLAALWGFMYFETIWRR